MGREYRKYGQATFRAEKRLFDQTSALADPPVAEDNVAVDPALATRVEDEVVVTLAGDRQASSRLLDAVISVARDLRLRDVLQRVVAYACQLVDARHGALGVAGPDRIVADIVHHGPEAGADEAADLLSDLMNQPEPMRVAGRLSVPLLIRGEVFGNLYVAEKAGGGPFTDEDQQTLVAFVGAAGIAVDNARMFELGRQRERWLQASNEITTALLAETPAGELQLITELARKVAGAPVAAIAIPHEQNPARLVFKVIDSAGRDAGNLVGSTISIAGTASGMVYSTGRPLLLDDYGDAAASWQDAYNGGAPPALLDLGSAAIVPLAAGEQILGVLLLIKLRGEQPFGEPDLELLRNFAAHAALAMRYAKARADQRRLAVFEDRDRIAADMQHLVITRLFDIGLSLQSVSRLVQPAVRGRVLGLVDELDGTIRELRSSIFSLREEALAAARIPGSLNDAVQRTISQAADALGFEPRVGVTGSLDSAVPEDVRPDLLATLREALANVARHAKATLVTVELRVADDMLTLDVLDDGIGIPAVRDRNSGLANLGRRAQRWGGNLVVTPGSADGGRGTRLTWRIPLP